MRDLQSRSTASARWQLLWAWSTGLLQVFVGLLLAVWLIRSPAVFRWYYPAIGSAVHARDATAIVDWLSSKENIVTLGSKMSGGTLSIKELRHYADVRAVLRKVPPVLAPLTVAWVMLLGLGCRIPMEHRRREGAEFSAAGKKVSGRGGEKVSRRAEGDDVERPVLPLSHDPTFPPASRLSPRCLESESRWSRFAGPLEAAQWRGLILLGVLLVSAALLAAWDWKVFFAWVHYPFFGERSWKLADSAYSLKLFPTAFWQMTATSVFLIPAVLMGTVALGARFARGCPRASSLPRVGSEAPRNA